LLPTVVLYIESHVSVHPQQMRDYTMISKYLATQKRPKCSVCKSNILQCAEFCRWTEGKF